MDSNKTRPEAAPSVAPGMNTHDQLEEKASAEEVKSGDYTTVTRLFLDRTPDE
ncbi:hypothetical protein [Brevibacillus borstelensis]|uniref:hypothetical protein n=1 Tax=Brevibacillus borstelensis TaxID=45462 RepID=UPI0030BC0500